MRSFSLFPVLFLFLSGLSPAATPKRHFSIGTGSAPGIPYEAALDSAQALGINTQQLMIAWNLIEPDSGVYDFNTGFIGWAPAYYRARGIKTFTYIYANSMMYRNVPRDLINEPWDSPRLIARYNRMLDTVARFIDTNSICFIFGNESDLLLKPQEYAAYRTFLNSVRRHFKTLKPAIPTGMVLQAEAFLNPVHRAGALALIDSMDLLCCTYYGLSDDSVLPPATLEATIDTLVKVAGGRPLLLTELGYPTAAAMKSSPLKQADFFGRAFAAWERHPASLSLIHFMKQWEWTDADLFSMFDSATLRAGGPFFVEYLKSLGLHDSAGKAKPAWDRLRTEASAHGFLSPAGFVSPRPKPTPSIAVHPNPFLSSVHIQCPASVRQLRLFRPDGRLIADLSPLMAHRNGSVEWNGRSHSPGLYLLRAETAEASFVRTLLLLR